MIVLVEVVLISVTILQKVFIPEADLASINNTLFSLSITDSVLTLRLLLTSFWQSVSHRLLTDIHYIIHSLLTFRRDEIKYITAKLAANGKQNCTNVRNNHLSVSLQPSQLEFSWSKSRSRFSVEAASLTSPLRIPTRASVFCTLQNVQIGSLAHTTS